MENKNIYGVIMALLLVGAGCSSSSTGSSSSGGSDSGTSLSTIDQLPKATSPVVDSSSSALKIKNATTGINLGSLSEETFDTDSSIASCEATMRFKEAITSAAQGDLILCYVQEIFEANDDGTVDIYDGQTHVFDMAFTGASEEGEDNGGPSRVKMTISKNSSGAITNFEMFACGDGGGADQQSEYLRQTIGSDGSFDMVSKGFFGGEGNSHHVQVTGALDSAGRFTSKSIDIAFNYEGEGFGGHGEATVVQESDAITFNGYESGTFSGPEGGDGTYSNRAYAKAELLDTNTADSVYNLQLLAVGDGAAHALFTGSFGTATWTDDVTEGWNGDTTMEDSETAASYITDVQEVTPVAAASSVTISFNSDESYNCRGTADKTVTITDMEALDAACSHLDLGHEWIDCWSEVGNDME